MGKHSSRKSKKPIGAKSVESTSNPTKNVENSPRSYDKDNAIFISMSHDLKDEGNKLFQIRDYEGAMLKYSKAIKLLPSNHIDVSSLRSNMAACYMQLGLSEYPRAIHECNLALEVTPKYSKALLKRARCYEALNRLDLALRDVGTVLKMEKNNMMAVEIEERVKKAIMEQGRGANEILDFVPEYVEPRQVKEKARKKKGNNLVEEKKVDNEENEENKVEDHIDEKKIEDKEKAGKKKGNNLVEKKKVDTKIEENKVEDRIDEKKTEDKLVVEEEKISTNGNDEEPKRTIKLVHGEDIRWAQIPLNCTILTLREVISDRFPGSNAILVKYRDQEGDLVTITSTEELRWAEASAEHGSVKLYIVEVNPDQDPFFRKARRVNSEIEKRNDLQNDSICIADWIVQFAQFFKNYVGFDVDAYLDLYEVGTKLYSEAMEETVTSEEAQELFTIAEEKFQEMAALALFNWGNVHMSRARKRVYFAEEETSVLTQVKETYDWAQNEYVKAGKRYEEALKIKPDFYEAILALGQQQFEQAKLSWYYAVGTEIDLETWNSDEILELYNKAEENIEKGTMMWEEAEEGRLVKNEPDKVEIILREMKLDGLFKSVSPEEAAEQAANIRSQIYVLCGTMLYERSIMEFKLGLPVWQECLEVAVEKFELAGASPTDVAVMIKNHCSNDTALDGLGFNIDEIVQAWNEMYEAKRWQSNVPSFRLEPLLRRRASKLYYALEHP